MKKTIPFIILVIATASCAMSDRLRLNEADNGKTNAVLSGSEIEVVLEGNPTTGYSWDVASFSTNKLQQIGTVQYQQHEPSGGRLRVGVGGKFTFRFRAIKSGQSDIKLIYRRSWETTVHDKVYSVILDVK